MKKPIIGLTTYLDRNEHNYPIIGLLRAYVDAVNSSGGTPVLIPSTLSKESLLVLADYLDGILFTGGGDIRIECFQGEKHPKVNNVQIERDDTEFFLLEQVIKKEKPFLGICRGCQVVNVGLGGTLFTDIEAQKSGAIKHDYFPNYPRTLLVHQVDVVNKNSRFYRMIDKGEFKVNSLHHQGIKDLAPGVDVIAIAPDGLVECIELPDYRFGIAVQWHPEWLMNNVVSKRLLKAFIEASSNL
jgi:putative glutamine amidotransferase